MKLTIHKGKQRPRWWWLMQRLWFNKRELVRYVKFDFSAKYELPGEDGSDVNKLFGIGYLWNGKESARYGWRWDNETEKVVLFAFYHKAGMKDSQNVMGEMDFVKLYSLERNTWYRLSIYITEYKYIFRISSRNDVICFNEKMVDKSHKKNWGYYLGFFFGGNQKAPHDISIEMKKK